MSAKTDKDSYHVDSSIDISPPAVVVDRNWTSMFVFLCVYFPTVHLFFSVNSNVDSFNTFNSEYLCLFCQLTNNFFFVAVTHCTAFVLILCTLQ